MNHVQVGTIMIREGFLPPDSLRIETESYSKCWRRVKDLDGFALGENIKVAGWTYFFNAAQIQTSYVGWRSGKSADRAFARLLGQVKALSFNSVEVTAVSRRHFMGIPYTAVSAHGRHIQEGHLLQAEPERRRVQADLDWARS